jgi:hypothetical protein
MPQSTIPVDRNLVNPLGNINLAVALGAIRGWRTFRKFGMNPDVDAGTEEIWPIGTPRVLPTVAGALSIVSSSAEDDPDEATPPGTGGWTLFVEGLDSNYELINETVTLTGLTPVVSTSSDWFRVNRAYCITAGSTEVNVGNITISIGGDTQAYIEALQGQTHQTHYTVPAETTLIIQQFHITGGRMGNTDMQIWSQVKLFGPDTSWRTLDDTFMYENNFVNDADVFTVPAKSEVRQRIVGNTVNGEIACTFSGFLVDDFISQFNG